MIPAVAGVSAAPGSLSAAPPAIVIAAPASGSGKTTITTGLLGALVRAGHHPAPFKVGPDYIDPSFHAVAAGRPGRNLDPVLQGEDLIAPLYRHGALGADVGIVEGVMGLFDGKVPPLTNAETAQIDVPIFPARGSTAQVAALLGAPVVLVVDVRGHSQSLAALLHGFSSFDPAVRIAGVILNRVSSVRHEAVLRAACAHAGLGVIGALPSLPDARVGSRHLGLIPTGESDQQGAIAAMTEMIRDHVDLGAILAAAGAVPAGPRWDPAQALAIGAGGARAADRAREDPRELDPGPVIAIAAGPAFTFGYREHLELLAAAGARVVTFDPRVDPLPERCAGLVLPGGFPELHAPDLAANVALHRQIRSRVHDGMPVYAECAGLLYLGATLDGAPMSAVLDHRARFGARLTLGYRDAVALTDSVSFRAGERVTGHEFHRTEITSARSASPAWGWHGPAGRTAEGSVRGSVHASYLHVHPAGYPQMVARFVAAAAAAAAC